MMMWAAVWFLLFLSSPVLAQTDHGALISPESGAYQTVNTLAAAGITITGCTVFTSLNNATFSVDSNDLSYLDSLRAVFKTNGTTFPTALSVPVLTDTSGTAHLIASLVEFTDIDTILSGYAWALQSYLHKVAAGQSPSLPPTTSSTYGPC